MDNQDIQSWYMVMNEASAYIRALPPRKQPSEPTIKQYALCVRRMAKHSTDPLTLSKSRNTYYAYRAAWCYIYETKAKELLIKADKEKEHQKKINLIKKLQYCVECIQRIPPDFAGNHLKKSENGQYESEWKQANKPKQKSRSKKLQISKLPREFQKDYFDYLKKMDSKYILPICLLSLCGARPAEIEGGVSCAVCDGGIRFIVNSKKTHKGKYGQETRSFTVKSDTPEFHYLLNHLNNGESIIKIDSAKNFGEQMRNYSKSVFPRLKNYISPYTFRHIFASHIKATLTDEQVSIVLGHCNDISQTFYGNSKKESSVKVGDIRGTRKVKLVTKNNMSFENNECKLRP